MKKTLLFIAFAAVAQISAWAQASHTFTQTTGTYANLTAPTTVSLAAWDEETYMAPIGFSFTIGGITYTDVEISDNGFVDFFVAPNERWIDAFYSDLTESSVTPSSIGYLLTGTAGSRILKIEWRNAGFFDGTASEYINFQLWLYEGSNKIEIHYGTSNITSSANIFPSGGPDIGLASNVASTGISGVYLQGSAASPTAVTLNNATGVPNLTGVPANGTIYAFMPTAVSGISKDQLATAVSVFPNPAANVINFRGLADLKVSAPVTVSDITGKVLLTETLGANQQLNISNLPKGSYMVKILTDKGQVVKHVVKQ